MTIWIEPPDSSPRISRRFFAGVAPVKSVMRNRDFSSSRRMLEKC
jgi:hypothetical protein